MSSSLPVAFSFRQKLRISPPPTSSIPAIISMPPATTLLTQQQQQQQTQVPSGAVRHRMRTVLPETIKDTAEPLHMEAALLVNETTTSVEHHSHQPDPAILQLVQDMPVESVLLLNIVAVIWGSQHPVIKMVVDDCDPSAFSLVRFALAAVVASVFSPTKLWEQQPDKQVWRWGAEMGLWMFLGYAFQAVGLEFTTAQRSGFLLYLNVKFVPFFARIFFGRQISIPTWASAFVAVLGTALLSWDPSQASLSLNVGDLWSIAAAATSAMFILRLEAATAAVSDSAALNAACLWVVTGAALVWTLGQGVLETSSITESLPLVWSNIETTMKLHPVELVYLSTVTTALANYIQTRGQRNVSAERASVIYAMDPVYGAVFSYWLLGESLSSTGIVGASLITIAAATNAFLDLGSKGKEQTTANDEAQD